jgi:hypothetical protein
VQDSPFLVKVYDKDLNFKAFIGDPITLVVTPRFNQTGTATLVVDLEHRAAPYLLADGARLVIFLRGQQLMSGKIHRRAAIGPSVDGTLTVYLKDDFRLLHQVLGWPVPGADITAQGASEYATYTGNAETIAKAVIDANIRVRLGMPVAMAANQNRGATVPDGVKFRFHLLYEQLFPAIEQAGIGITMRQGADGTGYILCDVFVPPAFNYVLTEDSGLIANWSWTDEDPTATRVVAGGGGEGTARIFRRAVSTALETAHRDVVEDFQDARDADTAALTQTRATEGLVEGEPKAGFAVQLSESANFQYGKNGLVVGAQVTISIGAGVTHTDILREVTLSYTRDEGLVTTPVVGDIRDSPDHTIANFLARLKKGINDLKVSK